MLSIKTVLAPIDFSDRSDVEAETAVNIARHFGSLIVLLHVIPRFTHLHPIDPTATKDYQRKFEDEFRVGLETALKEMAGRLGLGEEAETLVRSGDPCRGDRACRSRTQGRSVRAADRRPRAFPPRRPWLGHDQSPA